jgi:hypothetical protein
MLTTGWDVPLRARSAAAPAATELDAFLRVIRREEDKLASHERLDTKLMITRLRKLFYGGRGWDEYLIPGAAAVAPLYRFAVADPVRREFELPGPNVVDFVVGRPQLDGAPPQLTRPGELQDVRMPDGEVVDVGHALAGLDAINHPAAVAPHGLYAMARNVDAVTWAGDLGSALGEILFQRARLERALTDAEVQAQIDLCSPPHDMLGNVDAYAIAAAYDIGHDAGRTVSDILLDYYGAPATGGTARSRRFTTFALEVGLGHVEAKAFAAESAWLNRYERELGHAAALYVGATGELALWSLPYGIGAKLGLMKSARDAALRRVLLKRFVASLRAEVARECSDG